MATKTRTRNAATGGTPGGAGSNQPGPGSYFRVPKVSTRRRFVPDQLNENVPIVPDGGGQVPVPMNKMDQLDIVTGEKLFITGLQETWTKGSGKTLTVSPFFPASMIKSINFKLQAAYNSFNQTGPLAAIAQAFRPMFGAHANGLVNPNVFAKPAVVTPPPTDGTEFTLPALAIDVPLSIKFDEYWDLDQKGNPRRKIIDAIVTPQFMAAQARVITPSITLAPHMTVSDLLGGPVARASGDTTSTFAVNTNGTLEMDRWAYWTAKSPLANPPQYPWQYTRDYFSQPTQGQGEVPVLIQNTGVSVGQVMALYGFVWDPDADGGLGAVVPLSDIAEFQLVTGGSLLNRQYKPVSIIDRMQSLYPNLVTDFPDGVFVIDFAMCDEGGYLTNEECINTYLVNGVALVLVFKPDSIPGARATVYLGVEALKMATS